MARLVDEYNLWLGCALEAVDELCLRVTRALRCIQAIGCNAHIPSSVHLSWQSSDRRCNIRFCINHTVCLRVYKDSSTARTGCLQLGAPTPKKKRRWLVIDLVKRDEKFPEICMSRHLSFLYRKYLQSTRPCIGFSQLFLQASA